MNPNYKALIILLTIYYLHITFKFQLEDLLNLKGTMHKREQAPSFLCEYTRFMFDIVIPTKKIRLTKGIHEENLKC